ncbi:hypothetical protein CR513_17404, partial [Mucuna pruriens]
MLSTSAIQLRATLAPAQLPRHSWSRPLCKMRKGRIGNSCCFSPLLLDVVKKEVTKLLAAGIIYPISDSQWVSPVQVVPKKSGMTVMKNQQDEL